MPFLLALLAAVCYAGAYVLQYHEAHEAPARLFLSPRLLLELAGHPIWLLGLVAMVAGNLLQAAALGVGSLAVVEPLLASSLLFALPLSAAWRRERLCRTDWYGAVLVSGGLAAVLVSASPRSTEGSMPAAEWAITVAGVWAAATVLVAVGRRLRGAARAAVLAGAGGALFGLQDALTRGVIDSWEGGFLTVLTSWRTWLLLVTALYGLTLVQSAYEAGTLQASLPALNIGEPVVGVAIGVVALGEHISTGGIVVLWEVLGAVATAYGTYLLARSPLVLGRAHPDRQRAPTATRR